MVRWARPPLGDFFVLGYSQIANDIDLLTIVFSGSVLDPTFYIHEMDAINGEITASPGGTQFASNITGAWLGDVFRNTGQSGLVAHGAVRYGGLYSAGSIFTFAVDYSIDPGLISSELIALGISATSVPEPATSLLLALGLAGVAASRSRRTPDQSSA